MSDTDNYPGSEKKEGGKKKDGKKDKKEKGYVMFEDGSDEELMAQDDLKSPSKMKKGKAFRFVKKDIFPKVKLEDKKEKEGKKDDKEKKEGKKHKLKVKKKSKQFEIPVPKAVEKPVFGVPLSLALERNRSHDGIQLPALFRECIDYIEEHGLNCEGIYRISGVKSKVQHLKDSYNRGDPVFLEEHEPNIVASVLKLFLRELPDPVLTNALIPKFEEASTIRNERRRIEGFLKMISKLPEPNRLLLSWMIVHMTHVIEKQKENKMTLQNVSIVLSPTMQISHRVLNVLFSHTKQLFKNTVIKRYIPPLKPATSKWSLELPDNPQALSEELLKQESLLNQLHEELAAGKEDPEKEEQIWEVQRICTQLKRKIKMAQNKQDKGRKERDEQSKRNTVLEEGEEELNLALRELPPECEELNLELKPLPTEAVKSEEKPEEEMEAEATPAASTDEPAETKPEKDTDEQPKKTLKEIAAQSNAVEDTKAAKVKTVKDTDTAKVKTVKDTDAAKVKTVKDIDAAKVKTVKDIDAAKVKTVKDTDAAKVKTVKDIDAAQVSDDTDTREEEEVNTDDKPSAEKPDEETVAKTDEDSIETDKEANKDKKEVEDVEAKVEEENIPEEVKVDNDAEEPESKTDDTVGVTVEEVSAEIKAKEEMMIHEDTTDSEMGKSQEDLQQNLSESEDEFENSLEEILERDLNEDSDKEPEIQEDKETMPVESRDSPEVTDESVAMETKTPVPAETPESPPTTTTPVPGVTDDQTADAATESEAEEVKNEETVSVASVPSEDESFDEEEYQELSENMFELRLEEEELLAIESELRKKIATERCEAERLQQEIDELQYMRQDSDEEMMSTSSDSSYESEDEDDLQEILNQLLKENEELEKSNSEMCGKIHEERMICLDVKVQIRMLQQKQIQNSANSDMTGETDALIEFD